MQVNSNNFVSLAEIAIHKPELQEAVSEGTRRAYEKRAKAMFADSHAQGEFMRQQAYEAKRRALRNLPEVLETAEANLQANGFKVLWAVDADEASRHVQHILKKHHASTVIKSKSMLTEEIGLNHVLEDGGIRVVETDLGEYIIQLNHEVPSHIVAPVIHKTKAEIRDIFMRELNMESTDDAAEMVAFARKMLRRDFLNADVGISGGNFVIAETGSLGLVMNEGNGRMCTTMPDVHIALVGIEKVIENLQDYATLNQVLTRTGTGQNLTVYTNIINGPRREGESDGPDDVYIIFVDNGRSEVYGTKYAEALSCIRCGACQNACPVYRNVGGHAYGWVYGGPIGAVLTPLYTGLENASPLPHASSLCGSCKQVCPVDIDLPRMLLDLRYDLVKEKVDNKWQLGLKGWAMGMQSPALYGFGARSARFGKMLIGDNLPSVFGGWTKYRDFPDFAPKTFHQMWQERQKGKLQ
ncbi:MAG: iron-sulfur cluster-binding protein [Anaerolineaceae bacterium]|nr:iron-sulfur cluster-binding protein [Anaerolineaceae bacterium]